MEANEVGTDTRDEFAGFIFMCNRITKPECYRYRVFALPAGRKHIVERINPGTYLFLFDTDVKLLYGTYLATSPGMLNIQPSAFGGRFPAQVSFKIHQDCLPLPESHFKHAIKDNYQNHSNKFNPELNIGQVRNLLEMFRPLHPMSTAPTHPVLNGVHSASTLQLPPVNSVFHQSSRASLSEDSFLPRMSPSQAIRLLSQKYLNGQEEPTGWANSVAVQSVPSQASRNQIHALASIDTTEGTYATGTVSSYTPSLPYRQYAHQNNGIGHAQSMQNYQHAQLNVLHPQPQFHASVMTAGSNHSYNQSLQYSQQAYLNVSHPPPEYHSSTMTNNSYTQSLQDPQQSILNPPPPGVHPPAANVDSNHAQMLWYPHGTHQNIQNLQPGYYPSAVNVSSSYAQSFQDPQYTHQQAQNLQPGYGSSVNMDHTNAVMQSHASSSLYYPYVHQQVISGTYAVQGSAPIGSEYYQPSMPTE
ncbi:unnamed protein product [Trifolium pratense]|uniref:Uncharacterized protein n=1 Tax=Trifolium pratense TaxID=57577 RepID=A0ACB0J8G2_TRIPR|nr:unnamed protein product [Trifolium pratense]